MVSIVFLLLASVCNAIMDVCSYKFRKSILALDKDVKFLFWTIDKHSWWRWWNGEYSWRNKYLNDDVSQGRLKIKHIFTKLLLIGELNYPVQLTDAWHLFKTLMIIFICSSISHPLSLTTPITNNFILDFFIYLTILGIVWNKTFSYLYKNKLRKNEKNS